MKAFTVITILASLVAGSVASAMSLPQHYQNQMTKHKNVLKVLNSSDPGDDFPPIEHLEPIRFGTWKAKVLKSTVVYQNGEWHHSEEVVCDGRADAAVFDSTGKDNFTLAAPESTWIQCQLSFRGESFSVSLVPWVMFGNAIDPFTGIDQNYKGFSAHYWPVRDLPPPEFFDAFRLAENFYTKDLGLTNAQFAAYNFQVQICSTPGDPRPEPGPSSGDNQCQPPEEGQVFESFTIHVELNDPVGGRP